MRRFFCINIFSLKDRLFTTRCMNSWRKRSWFRSYVILPRNLSWRLPKPMRKSHNSRSAGRDLNPTPPCYDVGLCTSSWAVAVRVCIWYHWDVGLWRTHKLYLVHEMIVNKSPRFIGTPRISSPFHKIPRSDTPEPRKPVKILMLSFCKLWRAKFFTCFLSVRWVLHFLLFSLISST